MRFLKPLLICDNEIVPDQLDPLQTLVRLYKAIPVVLGHQVFNKQNGIFLYQLGSAVDQFLSGHPVSGIEVGVRLLVIHFAGSAV